MLDGSATLLPSPSSSWLLVSDVLLLDVGMEQPLMLLDVPNMAMDDFRREGNNSLVSEETREMAKREILLKLRGPPLHAVVALDLLHLVVAGVLAATMYGLGTGNGEVGQVPGIDMSPVNTWIDHLMELYWSWDFWSWITEDGESIVTNGGEIIKDLPDIDLLPVLVVDEVVEGGV